MHFDDYAVFASPLADFTREVRRRGLGDRNVAANRGASVTVQPRGRRARARQQS